MGRVGVAACSEALCERDGERSGASSGPETSDVCILLRTFCVLMKWSRNDALACNPGGLQGRPVEARR